MISTIVINLRRRPDRKKFAIAECKNIDIDPIILDATDAKYLAEEWIERSATSEMREKIADPNFHGSMPFCMELDLQHLCVLSA